MIAEVTSTQVKEAPDGFILTLATETGNVRVRISRPRAVKLLAAVLTALRLKTAQDVAAPTTTLPPTNG